MTEGFWFKVYPQGLSLPNGIGVFVGGGGVFVGGRVVLVGTVGRGVKVMVAGPRVGVVDGVKVGNGVLVGPVVLVGGAVGILPPLSWI